MKTVYAEAHRQRNAKTELSGGAFVPPFECPARADNILAEILRRQLGPVVAPDDFGLEPIRRVHAPDYLHFLETCWPAWQAAGYEGEAVASVWPSRAMPRERPPRDIGGRIGYYALAAETSITEGTWAAARAAAHVALTGQQLVARGEPAAFALCRPPGHHASADMFGGYCFLNNVAIAAQASIDAGAQRVAVLDIDVHHGNGTQQIFYERSDVLFISIHGDPDDTFPYFLGYADERGAKDGEGFNVNHPVPPGATYDAWAPALDRALARIENHGAEIVLVSLGVDTYEKDPISPLRLKTEDFLDIGARLRRLRKPTLFVMEGGYALDEIGVNTTNVLEGFEAA